MSVNDIQIGGKHYKKAGEFQHWDWVEDNGVRYLEGCATKYVARNRFKNATPIEDLEKARHYIDKMIERHSAGVYSVRPYLVDSAPLAKAYVLTPREADIVDAIVNWADINDLRKAQADIDVLIAYHKGE